MLEHARKAHPRECCGILLGERSRICEAVAARNIHPQPERFFEIDPATLIAAHRAAREGALQVAGYYHSHPAGPAAPSAVDTQMAAADGMIWAIAANGSVGFWRASENGFESLSYALCDG